MSSFFRLALSLALICPAVPAALAQSSSSNPATPEATQQPAAGTETQGEITVQARIRARRAQRRALAIQQAYAHRYEGYFGMGYLRFVPGVNLQRAHEYAWDAGVTRYFNERLGITGDARGYFGAAYVYNNAITNSAITNVEVTQYTFMAGPTYRFYMQPKVSVAGRILAGMAYGHFTGDLNGSETLAEALGLWPNGPVFAANASLIGEYNLTPRVSARLAPEFIPTGFGSTIQHSFGFSVTIGYRFGKM